MIARVHFVIDPDKVPSCFEVDFTKVEATILEAIAKACPILAVAKVEVSHTDEECEHDNCHSAAWVDGRCMTHFDEMLQGAR